jgi:hypothetical protein
MKPALLLLPLLSLAANISLDRNAVQPGPIRLTSDADQVNVEWPDQEGRTWSAHFSLDPAKPLIASIRQGAKRIVTGAQPLYWVETGKRRGGWDQFFDFPPSHPEGTRRFQGRFRATAAVARSFGERLELRFEGLRLGIFSGSVAYTFYPGSRLIHQEAIVKTSEPDTAFFFDAGITIAAREDSRPGRTMASEVAYYDTAGQFQIANPEGSERHPFKVKHRTIAARTPTGALAVFPEPHRYFIPRDYTTNLGFLWASVWRGNIALGTRQLPDDHSPFYPWANAPPDTEQRLGLFLLANDKPTRDVLDEVLSFTRRDRFAKLPGHVTYAPHWHHSYTEQAMAHGYDWVPPFKPVLIDMGVDIAATMDFHGDLHPADTTDLRLRELDAYYAACERQSNEKFLLIPSEEANVHLGGHWAVTFPKKVLWHTRAVPGQNYEEQHPKYGRVYNVSSPEEMIRMIRAEDGYAYMTHPRTKGSTGFPDAIKNTDYFRDRRYAGIGWKSMPTDYSRPRLGERSLNLLDDMANWGERKNMVGEVDVFQVDSTHELYAHMNVNYVRAPRVPAFANRGAFLETVARGELFVTTGEILLPEVKISQPSPGEIQVQAELQHTFPLRFAELVWGDGQSTHRHLVPLETSRAFGNPKLDFKVAAPNWKWARFAAWDIAANGAMTNPTYNDFIATKRIAVDAFHNREPQPHYRWQATYQGGFSGLGDLLTSFGARLATLEERFTKTNLAKLDGLILVDPDTPTESQAPKYFDRAEIDAIEKWVHEGGRLVMLGNDPGNAEFTNWNKLAARFGLRFEERKHADAKGNSKLRLPVKLPETSEDFYAVDLSPITVTNPKAKIHITEGNTPLLVEVQAGRGAVLALGDPWLYNEYLHTAGNHRLARHFLRHFFWIQRETLSR